jgi:hypothetical protein
MLRKIDAEQMVLAAVRSRQGHEPIGIASDRTIERVFGWLFFLTSSDADTAARAPTNLPRQVIVNRYSSQIVASSIDYEPERLIKLYEKFLAHNQAAGENWCLTVSVRWPWERWWNRSVERKAREAGFYEIGGKENEP